MAADMEQSRYEEISGFPEKISAHRPVDEPGKLSAPIDADDDFFQAGKGEEMSDISGDYSPPSEIHDEYPHAGESVKNSMKNEFDVSSLAAEIDGITRIQKPKPATRPEKNLPAENHIPNMTETKGHVEPTAPDEHSVIINEEDDVDLDYYSLEELEGKMEALQSSESAPAGGDDKADRITVSASAGKDGDSVQEIKAHKGVSLIQDDAGAMDIADLPGDAREIGEDGPEMSEQGRIIKHARQDNRITLEVPDELRERLPKDFDISDLTTIDLKEAEQIANEDMVLLTEDDLIVELEEFDLVPLERPREGPPAKRAKSPPERAGTKELKSEPLSVPKEFSPRVIEEIIEDVPEIPVSEIIIPAKANAAKKDESAGKISPREEMPPEVLETSIKDEQAALPPAENQVEAFQTQKPEETPDKKGLPEIKAARTDFDSVVLGPLETEPSIVEHEIPAAEEALPAFRDPDIGITPGAIVTDKMKETSLPAARVEPRAASDRVRIKEQIPSFLAGVAGETSNIFIIDDPMVDRKESRDDSPLQMDELEKITSEIATVMEGAVKFLYEASPTDDARNIAPIMKGATPAFEDLLADLESEYSFKDDEMELVDSVFVAEDYQHYIRDIDAQTSGRHDTKISSAVELLGLDSDEIGNIDGSMFSKEYEGIDLEERIRSMKIGLDQPLADLRMLKKCSYLLPRPDSLTVEEQKSIEEDVSSPSAFIFEEDVAEIRYKLNQIITKRSAADEKIPDISGEVIILDNSDDMQRFMDTIPAGKKDGLKNLLWYLDGLFEKLPEEIIRKFAESEYFDLYSKVLTDLGK